MSFFNDFLGDGGKYWILYKSTNQNNDFCKDNKKWDKDLETRVTLFWNIALH